MRRRLAVLCAGQGEQAGLDFAALRPAGAAADAASAAQRLWVAASRQVGHDWAEDWATRSQEARRANRHAQLAVVVWQGLTWLAWQQRAAQGAGASTAALPTADWVVGYSVGELAAHAIAGSLDWADLPALAVARAAAMDACIGSVVSPLPSGPGGGDNAARYCLLLLNERLPPAARSRRQIALDRHGLALAIQRSPGEAVWGGPAAAVAAFLAESQQAGWGARLLPVTVPSHTRHLRAARPAWTAALDAVQVQAPRHGVLAGITGEPVRTADSVRQTLIAQLEQPIQWALTLEALRERGITHALDLGPGRDQSRLLEAVAPAVLVEGADPP